MATFAAQGDLAYNVVLLAHFLCIIVGAGMAFMAPMFVRKARRIGGRHTEDFANETSNAVIFPALLLAGIAGGALVGLSDDAFDFEQMWLTVAGVLWIASLVLALVAFPPRWLNIFNANEDRRRLARIGLHVVLVLLMIDMIWKESLF